LNNSCELYEKKGDYETAKKNYEQALVIFTDLKSLSAMCEINNNIANVSSLQKNPQLALEYAQKAWGLVRKTNEKPMIRDISLNTSKIYSALKDFEKAYEYHQIYASYKDSIFSKENTDAIARMQEIYESEKKEQENRLLKNENEQKAAEIDKQRLIAQENQLIAAKQLSENALLQQEKALHLAEIEKKQLAAKQAELEAKQKATQITLLESEKTLQENQLKLNEKEL
jgi:tetratricopeptide (TPR) repeat protein